MDNPSVDLAQGLVLTPPRWPLLVLAGAGLLAGLFGLFLFAAGVALGAGATAAGVGFVIAVVFGGLGVMVLKAARPERNSLRLDRDGLAIRRLAEEQRYAWRDIVDVELVAGSSGPRVVLKLGARAAEPAAQRWLRRNPDFGAVVPYGGRAEWLTSNYGLDPAVLRDLLAAWREAALGAEAR
jgi:hypothetical protein